MLVETPGLQRIRSKGVKHLGQLDLLKASDRGMPFALIFLDCLKPVAWLLSAFQGYRLSKPLETKVTHLLYVDDLKVFAASEAKLNTVL